MLKFVIILIILYLILILPSWSESTFQRVYATDSCKKGEEVAVNVSSTSSPVCLDPYELEMACDPRGSLAGNPACSAISSPDAIEENFPSIQNYSSQIPAGIPGGEQEVIEEAPH